MRWGPHVSHPGGLNPWSTGSNHRRFAAGNDQMRWMVRVSHSGDQMGGRGHLCVAGSEPRQVVVVVGLEVVRNNADHELGGCWSSAELELDAMVHVQARG